MSNKQIPITAGAATVLLAVIIFSGCGSNYSWQEHYEPGSKDPYGTYLLRNLLESYNPHQRLEVVTDSLGERLDTGNYVYVGKEFWPDSVSLDQLLRFVERGNKAFIACPFIPQNLLDSLNRFECVDFETDSDEAPFYSGELYQLKDTAVSLNFEHPSLIDPKGYKLRYLVLRQPTEYEWSYLPDDYLCDSQTVFTSLGLINREHNNFVSAAYGKGEFLLHTTPLAFTNLHLLDKRGLKYASKAFTHLKQGTIYWDERVYFPSNSINGGGGSNNNLDKDSPLKYILSQPTLAWAWYILLGMAVLYLVFRAKRRQRIIPVLEKNTNTSLEFIGTIGRLFFIQNNHRQLAAQKMRLFLIFVRERYRMPTKELNEQFAKSLAIRSNMPEELVTKILFINYNIERSGTITQDLLVDFHRLMERFYRECK